VFFDLDGTLTDPRDGIARCIAHALTTLEIPGALARLASLGHTLCVATSKPAIFARRILDHFELSAYFTRVHGPDLDDTRYTKATLVERALEADRLPPHAAVMVGDRADDIEGARTNGVRSIGVTWSYGSR